MKKKFWMVWDRLKSPREDKDRTLFAVWESDAVQMSCQYSSIEDATSAAMKFASGELEREYVVMEAVRYVTADRPSVTVKEVPRATLAHPFRSQIEEPHRGDTDGAEQPGAGLTHKS